MPEDSAIGCLRICEYPIVVGVGALEPFTKQLFNQNASLGEKSHNWYNIAVSPTPYQLYTFVSVLMYIRFVTKEGQDYSTDIKQSCPKRALLSRRKVRDSRVFKLVSVASTIQSPVQLFDLIFILLCIAFVAYLGYLCIGKICKLISSYNRVNVSGVYNEAQIEARLRR